MTAAFQIKTVRAHVEEARAAGASVLAGWEWNGESAEIPPIVLENVTPEMKVVREETFPRRTLPASPQHFS